MAGFTYYNITTFQGSDVDLDITVSTPLSIPYNFSGYGVRGQVRASYGSTGVLLNILPTISNSISGTINVNISADTMSTLPVGQFVYDIERYVTGNLPFLDSSNTEKILKGKFSVMPEVTRI